MIKNFNKRGELTTQQIVGLIILITSFAVILFLLFRLNLGEISEKEICHNSVVLKGQSPSNFDVGNLDCKTNYVCISGGEDCKDLKIDGSDTLLHYLYNTYKIEDLDKNYLSLKFDFTKQYFILTALGKQGFVSKMFFVTTPGFIIESFGDDESGNLENLPVIILEKTKENYDHLSCSEYLTKA